MSDKLKQLTDWDIEEICRNNPHIKPEQFKEAQELLELLRKTGRRKKGYGLTLPFTRSAYAIKD